jgi:hypothetical protein
MPYVYSYNLIVRAINSIESGTKASIAAKMFNINKDTV